MESLVGAMAIVWIFLIVLAILWFCLPFAVFGTQPKIEKVLAEVRRTNQILEDIRSDIRSSPRPKEHITTPSDELPAAKWR